MVSEQLEPSAKRTKVAGPSVTSTNDVITFHLLKKTAEGQVIMEEEGHFQPDMTHQLFGQEEEVEGYEGLEVDVWLTPRFQALLDIKHAGAAAKDATPLEPPFAEAFPAGLFTAKPDFDAALHAEEALSLEELGEVVAEAETSEGTTLIVTAAPLGAESAHPAAAALHARLSPLLFFFVDAASAIDAAEDPAWTLLLALERSPEGLEVLGFATVYSLYAYPERSRLRLSQILVLPPHQGRGVGSSLLQGLYALADQRGAVDVGFEDPTEALQHIRDKMDLERMLSLAWAREEAKQALSAVAGSKGKEAASGEAAPAALAHLALKPAALCRAQAVLRINRQQARRCWESLLFLLAAPQGGPVAEAVSAAVVGRVTGQVTSAKRSASGKSVTDNDKGFIMCRGAGGLEGKAPPAEGMSAEEQAAAIEEAAEQRLAEVERVVAGLAAAAAQ